MAEKSLDEVVAAVCRIPLDFHRGKESGVGLVQLSGYLDHRGEVTVERIEDRLTRQPALVDEWQTWSDDNRSSPAWYFDGRGPQAFVVGYVEHGEATVTLRFDDRTRACAEYVHRNLEQTADIAESWIRPWKAIRKRVRRSRTGRPRTGR